MAGEAFLPTKGSVSNRALISKMEQWGWKVKKVNGETTIMVTPGGRKLEVRSAHIHQGNSAKTIDELLSLMGMSWNEFIAPLDPAQTVALQAFHYLSEEERAMVWEAAELKMMTSLDRVKEQQRAEQIRLRDERRAEQKRERDRRRNQQQTAPQPQQELVPVTEPTIPPEDLPLVSDKPKVVREYSRTGGATNKVLDVLARFNGPVSIERLVQEESLAGHKRKAIQGGARYLVSLGLAHRVKTGVYRITEEGKRSADYKLDIEVHTTNGDAPKPEQPQPEYPEHLPSSEELVRVTAQVPAIEPTESEDDIVNETLDLLFPGGFKARHLPLIDDWRQATLALMREINK